MKKREYRATPGLELRQESGEPLKIRGYAAVFNELSEGLWFRERILPGAFTSSLKNDVRALVGHASNLILGRTKSNTLLLREDAKGLYIEIEPPNTQLGHDTVENIRRGDLDQMSIGFYVDPDNSDQVQWKIENKERIRELLNVDLFDVSVVAFPAYKQTSASVRSLWPDGLPEDLEKLWAKPPDIVVAQALPPGQRFQLPPDPPPPQALPKPSWARQRVEELEKKFGLNPKA